jgi:hypothetical protein
VFSCASELWAEANYITSLTDTRKASHGYVVIIIIIIIVTKQRKRKRQGRECSFSFCIFQTPSSVLRATAHVPFLGGMTLLVWLSFQTLEQLKFYYFTKSGTDITQYNIISGTVYCHRYTSIT